MGSMVVSLFGRALSCVYHPLFGVGGARDHQRTPSFGGNETLQMYGKCEGFPRNYSALFGLVMY